MINVRFMCDASLGDVAMLAASLGRSRPPGRVPARRGSARDKPPFSDAPQRGKGGSKVL